MSKAHSKYPDELVLAAAMLSARGDKQADIGRTLGISAPKASRVLREADRRGLRDPRPSVRLRNSSLVARRGANRLIFTKQLEPLLAAICPAGHICRVTVIDDARHNAFTHLAALAVLPNILESVLLGVAWGLSVSLVVEGLDRLLHESPRDKDDPPVRVVPVTGDPICVTRSVHQYSASTLAELLDEILNHDGKVGLGPSLSAVLAYLPYELASSRNGIHRLLARSAGYRDVIGDRKGSGLFQQLDALLTGIGITSAEPGQESGVFVQERALCEDISHVELARLVQGDIAGVLIPQAGLGPKDLSRVDRLNKGWTGLRLDDIQKCAQRANRDSKGGVVVVAQGAIKRDFVRELLRRGLVNHLVIDGELADAMEAAPATPTRRPRPKGGSAQAGA